MAATDPADVVRAVAAGVSRLIAGGLSPAEREAQLDALAALYAAETDVRHPFHPHRMPPLRTRAELREHFGRPRGDDPEFERFAPEGTIVHRTEDPEVVITEFAYEGSSGGREFSMPCIFVVRVRDGEIIESRDYADHAAAARAFAAG